MGIYYKGPIVPRPKNSKDTKKRKIKTILNSNIERNLIQDYEMGSSTGQLIKKYNVSKSYVSSLFKRRGLCRRLDHAVVSQWENVININDIPVNTSGIYVIYFVDNNDHNNIKVYVGSSSNIKNRLRDHIYQLKTNRHRSKKLCDIFNDANYILKLAIVEKCDGSVMMQKEGVYLAKWSRSCLLNSFFPTDEQTLEPWLKEAVKRKSYCKQYKINKITGCKESLSVRKDGYGAMRIVLPNRGKKYLLKHRVAYWAKTGQYPELVRHVCNNPKCYNEDHLVAGNHRDNALDKRKGFAEEFELKWLEYGADLLKLNDYYSGKWKANMKLAGSNVSTALYSWEKKLGLREKYPEIMRNNKDRRANKIV